MTEQQVRAAVNQSGFMSTDSADLFFNNEHVKKTLGLTSYSPVENTVSSSLKTPKTNFWTTASIPTTIDGGPEDEWWHIGCSKKVNSLIFDALNAVRDSVKTIVVLPSSVLRVTIDQMYTSFW